MSWFDENISEDLANQLIRIKITIDGQLVERDIRPDVIINYELLEQQLEETPSMFIFWSLLLAEAKKAVATLERVIDIRKGQVTKELLDAANKDGVKTRASDVELLLKTDESLIELESKLLIANRTQSKMFAIVDAIRMKSEHLRSLAGFKKQELRDTGQ
jgi:hypothetical protein